MPADYTILTDEKLLVIRMRGAIGPRDGAIALLSYGDDDRRDPADDYLVDMTDVTAAAIDYPSLVNTAEWLRAYRPARDAEARTAYVAPDTLTFGVARMVQQLAADWGAPMVGVFGNPSEALRFLEKPLHVLDSGAART